MSTGTTDRRTLRLGHLSTALVLAAAWTASFPAPAAAAPRVSLVVTADPVSGSPGARITFSYEVTNAGDVPLSNVAVTDDAIGEVGSVDRLRPGRTVTFTAQLVLRGEPIRNVAVVTATDPDGEVLRDRSVATVTVVAGGGSGTNQEPPTGGGLAFTGGSPRVLMGAAVLLLALGAALLALSGRRRSAER